MKEPTTLALEEGSPMHRRSFLFGAAATLAGVTTATAEPVIPYEVNLDENGEAGYLWSGYTPKNPGQPIAWKPQVGDIVLSTSPDVGQIITYLLARTTHPQHIALIIRQPDGELGIIESGGGGDLSATLRPILGRLGTNDLVKERRFIWVRRIKRAVTERQSQLMTELGVPQVGKPFVPYSRLAWFWTPGRIAPRKTTFDQEKWFCTELVVALLNEAGVLPKGKFKPGSAVPRALFTDCLCNDISDLYHAPLPWSYKLAEPPVPGPHCAPYRARE